MQNRSRSRAMSVGVAALVLGVVLLVWWLAGPGGAPIAEHRSADESPSDVRATEARTPLSDAGAGDVSGAAVADAPVRRSVQSDLGEIVAARLDAMLRPVRHEDGVPFAEFRVAAIAADGTRRDIRPDEAVHTSDLAAGGLWVVEAPRACARWLAPRELERREAGQPLELALAAASSIVVHVEPTPAGREPIAAIEVTAEGKDVDLQRSQLQAIYGDEYVTPEERNAIFTGLRELLVHTTPNERRRDALAALHARRQLASIAASRSTTVFDALAPWCERRFDGPLAAATTITSVPAGARVELVVHCADLLEIDSHRRDDHFEHAIARRMRSGPIRLGAGEAAEVTITYADVCSVHGRLPDDALTTADLRLFFRRPIETPRGTSYLRVSVPRPLFENERAFAWSNLPTGHYDFEARWNGAARDLSLLSRSFEVARGEAFDLGTLEPPSGATLTVVPRFVHADGSPFVSTLPPGRVVVAGGDITLEPDDPRTWRPGGGFDIELANGEPTVVRGLAPATYRVRATEIIERAADAPLQSSTTAIPRFEKWPSAEPVIATVRADVQVEIFVTLADVGSVVFEFDLDIDGPITDVHVPWAMVGGESRERSEFGISIEHRKREGGLTFVVRSSPEFGAWDVFVMAGVEVADGPMQWFSARGQTVVERGTDAVLRWPLERSAALRIAKSRIDGIMNSVVLADGARLGNVDEPMSRRQEGDFVILEGLFPRTEYVVLGSQRVTTGEPGSVVDVP